MTAIQQGTLIVDEFRLETMRWAKLTEDFAPFNTREELRELLPEVIITALGSRFSKFFQSKSFTGLVTAIDNHFPYSLAGIMMPRDNNDSLCVESPIPFTAKSGDDEGIMHLTFEGA